MTPEKIIQSHDFPGLCSWLRPNAVRAGLRQGVAEHTGCTEAVLELALLGARPPEMLAIGNRFGTAMRRLLCGAQRLYALGQAVAMERSER